MKHLHVSLLSSVFSKTYQRTKSIEAGLAAVLKADDNAHDPRRPRFYTDEGLAAATAASRLTGIEVEKICSVNRCWDVVRARRLAMAILRAKKISFPKIGHALGGMDHATVIVGLRELEKDPVLVAMLGRAEEQARERAAA